MAEKKYYWLKMTDQFFEDKAIKKLRKIAGGDTYTIIYLKMLLTAIKQGNKMYFEGIEDDFMEELALELDEDTDNVKVNYDPKVEGESRKINKPSFKHKVTSTVQITDKKDGNMDTEMELAFDEDSGEYVLQPVANTTQKSIFDSDYKENLKPENEEESEKEEPKGIPQLPGPSEVEDEDVIDAEYTETEIDQETDEEPEEDITDEILGDAEEPDDMDGYDYEDPEDEV